MELVLILLIYISAFFLNGKNRTTNIVLNSLLGLIPIFALGPILLAIITDAGAIFYYVFVTAPIGAFVTFVIFIIKLILFLNNRAPKKKMN